jgi:hypothetical protein
LGEQLTRYRRVTWALTAVPSLLGLIFLILFGVFGRPDIGLVFVSIILVPIVVGAWVDFMLLARRARRYLAERDEYVRRRTQIESATTETRATSGQA